MAGPSLRGISLSVQHLSPVLNPQNHSAAYGLLPDPLWPHLGYLLGLTVLVGALLLVLASRGSGQRVPLRPLLVVAVAGLVLVGDVGGQAARPARRRAGAGARPGHLEARLGRVRPAG